MATTALDRMTWPIERFIFILNPKLKKDLDEMLLLKYGGKKSEFARAMVVREVAAYRIERAGVSNG